MRFATRWILSVVILAAYPRNGFCIDPHLALDQDIVQTWGVDQGLPQGTVYAVAQTPEGYVWAATEEGFVRFDGSSFVVYDKAAYAEIRNNMTVALLPARDGSLYAATTGGGLVHVDGDRVQSFNVTNGLPSNVVTALYQSSDGTIWIGTQEGLARLQNNGRIVPVGSVEQLPHSRITTLTEDWSGQLWIGTTHGIATLKDGRLVAGDGSVWIGTLGNGLLRYRSGKFRSYTTGDGLVSKNPTSIYEDRHGTIWIGTLDKGIGRFRNDQFNFDLQAAGIGTKSVSSFLEDREGNLWIGSALGLTRIAEAKVLTFTTAQGLLADNVKTVHADGAGTLWVGTGRGLQTLDGSRTISKENAGLSSNLILSTWSGRDGSQWIGTVDSGLNRVLQGRTTIYNANNGLRSNFVLSVYEDRTNAVWVGTNRGLQRIVNGNITPDTYRLSGEIVGAMLEDRSGALWVATQDGGLNRITGASVSSFTTRNALSSDFVLSLYQDNTGAIWVGTAGGGISRYKGGRWATITTREGLFDDSIFTIQEDDTGFFWVSCNKGIFRVSRQQLDAVAERLQQKVTSVAYGKADGMKSRECNGGTQPVAWKTADGKLWFATVKGVAMVEPSTMRVATAPPVMIEGVFVDHRRLDRNAEQQTLAPGTRTLEFHYTGINFASPRKIHYQYKLDGFDQQWIDAGAQRVASYTNLRPGTYRFHVRAATDDGPWNNATAMFQQRPFFYQTPWFLTASIVTLVGVAGGAHRSRVNLVRASAERFKLLFDRNLAGEYRATVDGKVLDCNDACAKLLGFPSRADFMAHGISDLYWNEADRHALLARLRDQNSVSNYETSLRRADGTQAWVLMNIGLVADGHGVPILEATLVDITERKRAEDQIRYQAHHDIQTGLPNRALFKDRLTIALHYARRHANQVAVLCLDLDHLNTVNETLGRQFGDSVLETVAARLTSSVRQEDSVARVGGDEFTLLLMKPPNVTDVTTVGRKILQTIARPITVNGHEVNITASIGIAFYPQDGEDAETLLQNGTHALHAAKEAGRNTYQLCSPFLMKRAADRLSLESALHQALEQQEFVLHYQPQIDIRSQKLIGMEALLRWNRPGKSLLRPAEFIGVAEETQLILPIGEWALEAACKQGHAWHKSGSSMKMAVNVSPRQFQQPNFVSLIRNTLERTNLDPHSLEIEITETTAMQNPALTADILLDLKSLGISIAIDDFGIGHSSLNYLKRFPIDAVKIDQSFVSDITRGGSDAAIVVAVIAMAKAMNIRVIAEGVETDEQLNFLRENGCYEFQGYLLSRPLPAEALADMLQGPSAGVYTRRYARGLHKVSPTDH
ncbi:MAG: hypothetical protein DMF59_06080 [Acidobacteria bacterium]|nr:MAG: hypothetical protein DMF59_06080 [Acidobacteriota bacterium]